MSEVNAVNPTYKTESSRERRTRRDKRVQNVKTGGTLVMYIGSAGLMTPIIRKAREEQNGVMGLCAVCTGAILAVGLGNVASKIMNKTIDKVVNFWDDVKPNGPAKKEDAKDG